MIEKRKRITPEAPWTIPPTAKETPANDCCPECGEEFHLPKVNRCICRKPIMIAIPPGEHIHIQCPVHGDVKIYGPRLTWMGTNCYNGTMSCRN